ncbi:MAG: hypothetical protein U5K28_11440 [Halobacteriales archaeon]|nr:hypothetical protein [Halobacteriales archaeon]
MSATRISRDRRAADLSDARPPAPARDPGRLPALGDAVRATSPRPSTRRTEAVLDGHRAAARENGCIKRIGCVVNHVVTGFDSNCMVVWDVPDEMLDEYGERVGKLPYVTLCYHRPRRPEQGWEYNLFTMVHGRDPAAVDEVINELANEYLPVDHERLYSTATLKQTGAQYEELVETE